MLFVTRGQAGVRHFWTGKDACDECDGSMFPMGFHIRTWNGTKYADLLLCGSCSNNIPKQLPSQPIQERRSIIISEEAPMKSIAITPRRPDISDGRISSFDAAKEDKAPAIRTEDHTKLSGRADSTFLDDNAAVLIGKDVNKTIESKDIILETTKGIKLIEELSR